MVPKEEEACNSNTVLYTKQSSVVHNYLSAISYLAGLHPGILVRGGKGHGSFTYHAPSHDINFAFWGMLQLF